MDDGFSFQAAFNIAVGGLAGLFGWLLNMFWSNQKDNKKNHDELRDKVSQLEVAMVGGFVRRDEFLQHFAKIEATLQRIEDKLDGKQDK